MRRARWVIVGVGIAGALAALGGVATEGLRGTATITSIRSPRAAAADEPWQAHLASVDRAVETKDISRATTAWRDAYGAALGSRRWQPMLAVGQAALRIGTAAGTMKGYEEKARQCYLTALFRATQQNSAEGALLVAEAFADLGDVEVAARAIHSAETLTRRAGHDGPAPARVATIRARLRSPSAAPRDPGVDPSAAPLSREPRSAAAPPRRLLGDAP